MLEQALQINEQLVAWRRAFHQDPELGFQEFHTAARVSEVLSSLGYRVRTGVGKTGVVGEIGEGSPTVAMRADMDALPCKKPMMSLINPVILGSCTPVDTMPTQPLPLGSLRCLPNKACPGACV